MMMTRDIAIDISVFIILAGCITAGVLLLGGSKSTPNPTPVSTSTSKPKPNPTPVRNRKSTPKPTPVSTSTSTPKPTTTSTKPVYDISKGDLETETIIYTNFTLFNWTNPDEFNKTGIKPNFTKLGPYVLRQQKFVEASYSEPTVSRSNQTWSFEPKMSKGSLNDTVFMPNFVLATLAFIMQNSNESETEDFIMENSNQSETEVLNNFMKENDGKLYSVKKVRELISGWHNDSLLDYLDSMNITKYEHDTDCNNCENVFGKQFPMKFSGNPIIHQNRSDLSKIIDLKLNSSKCEISIGNEFLSQQSLRLRFLDISHGRIVDLKGKRKNGCEWSGSGLLDLNRLNDEWSTLYEEKYEEVLVADCSKCQNNWPIYASFPNFYLCDSEDCAVKQFIMPCDSSHQYSFILERESGKILQTKEGFKMNLLIQRDETFDFYKNVPEENTTMPLYYTEQIVKYNYRRRPHIPNHTLETSTHNQPPGKSCKPVGTKGTHTTNTSHTHVNRHRLIHVNQFINVNNVREPTSKPKDKTREIRHPDRGKTKNPNRGKPRHPNRRRQRNKTRRRRKG